MDQYSAMVGGAPTDAQSQQALAEHLRRQALLGQLALSTGDRVAGPLGKNLEENSMQGAEHIQADREKHAQMAQALTFHQQQMEHEQAALSQTAEIAKQHNITMEDIAKLAYKKGIDVQGLRNEGKEGGGKPIPSGQQKTLDALSDSLDGINNAIEGYKSGFGNTGLPGGRSLTNWAAANTPGLTTQNAKDAQNWWGQYGRHFTLPEMHSLFGARLNKQEMSRFEQYHIDPNMDDDQIVKNLQQIKVQHEKMISERATALRAGGYKADEVQEYLDRVKPKGPEAAAPNPVEARIAARRAQPPAAAQPPPAPFSMLPASMQNAGPINPNATSLFGGIGGG